MNRKISNNSQFHTNQTEGWFVATRESHKDYNVNEEPKDAFNLDFFLSFLYVFFFIEKVSSFIR